MSSAFRVEPDGESSGRCYCCGNETRTIWVVRAMGLEGVIAKRKASRYACGERSHDWQKLKLERSQEFVVGGYRLSSPASIDAVLVGYYERRQLRFASKMRHTQHPLDLRD